MCFCAFFLPEQGATHRKKKVGPQKTGPGSRRFPRILRNLWGSAGRFCKPVEARFCRTFGVLQNFWSQAQIFRPCQCFYQFKNLGAEKTTNKQKTHKHFSDGHCGTIVPGTNPHPSQGQTGQNGDFTVELNRERPVCPRDGSHFVPRRGPICPRDGSCLSRTPSLRKCLCLLVFFLPEKRVRSVCVFACELSLIDS